MTAPSLTLLLFILLVGIIVLLAAVIIVVLISTRRKPDSTAASKPNPAESTAVAPPDRFASIGRLYRDRRTGELVIERQGRLYRSAEALSSAGRKELESAAQDLPAWLELAPKAALSEAPAERMPVPTAAASPKPAIALVESAPAHRTTAALSMVEQIDEILQEMLITSEFADRKIHLSERPECGVLVWIGALRYEGIDAVPDDGVKTLLRAAVQEWERRQTV